MTHFADQTPTLPFPFLHALDAGCHELQGPGSRRVGLCFGCCWRYCRDTHLWQQGHTPEAHRSFQSISKALQGKPPQLFMLHRGSPHPTRSALAYIGELISATAFALAKRLFPAAACRPPACPLSRRNHQITQQHAVSAGRCHPSRREAAALQWNHWHMVHGSADAGGHALEGKPAVRARPAITDTHCITGLHLGVSALFCHKPALTAGAARAQQGMWT